MIIVYTPAALGVGLVLGASEWLMSMALPFLPWLPSDIAYSFVAVLVSMVAEFLLGFKPRIYWIPFWPISVLFLGASLYTHWELWGIVVSAVLAGVAFYVQRVQAEFESWTDAKKSLHNYELSSQEKSEFRLSYLGNALFLPKWFPNRKVYSEQNRRVLNFLFRDVADLFEPLEIQKLQELSRQLDIKHNGSALREVIKIVKEKAEKFSLGNRFAPAPKWR